jgi:hypothetical protein
MQYYITRNNQQLGPFTEAEVKAQLASGAISPQDHVWWEGQEGWITLDQSPLAGPAPIHPPAPALPGPPVAGVPAPAGEKTSGLAIASLICGITGLFCALLSVAAIICGHMSRSEIKKNPALKGSGFALAGLILGYIWLPIYVMVVALSVLIALGNQVKGTFKTINSQIAEAQAAQATNSADQSPSSPDQATNSAPASTNAPDQSTNNPATNSADSSTTNAPSTNSTNTPTATPMSQ